MEYKIYKINDKTWRIEEYDELMSVYMYLLIGKNKALLIDTGMGMIPLDRIVIELTKLPLVVLNTHGHFDHTGGNNIFETVYMHKADKEVYDFHFSLEMQNIFSMYTFPTQKKDVTFITEDMRFDLGGRKLSLILVPGHSPGSICILDETNHVLYSGDACCKAPVLLNMDYATSVSRYLESIKHLKTYSNQFTITWPSHHSVPVEAEIIDQFLECGREICEDNSLGENIQGIFYESKSHKYKDVSIEFFENKI
jgi:glyoxylase-like metal-dependent hydrolase (beta-lactamase superfamily II)